MFVKHVFTLNKRHKKGLKSVFGKHPLKSQTRSYFLSKKHGESNTPLSLGLGLKSKLCIWGWA
jgi:hypothetical protein